MRKEVKVFILLGCVFVANVILAEFIGVKIFSLTASMGLPDWNYTLFGQPMSLQYTAGVLIWPVVFVLTDIINDYYGRKGVRFLTFLAVGISLYAFFVVNLAINLEPAMWWKMVNQDQGIPDLNLAYKQIFGQGNNIIIGSLMAFVLGQFIDVMVFQKLKQTQKGSQLWVRATVSTLVSQFIDSFVVIFIAFYLGQGWPLSQVLSVSTNNYIYKGLVAILMIPVLHFIHLAIEKYLGNSLAEHMRASALKNKLEF
ncbi:MAG: queuosine precursor transporter [Chitinophagales bacterium]|nr:queuosine precursor transporter [Chitinophagales bacterium]